MRIKLKKGIQKKIIFFAKEKRTWAELSHILGFSPGYIRKELAQEKTTLNEEIYEKLSKLLKKNFDKDIIKKLDNNWGQAKGGKNSGSFKEPKLLITKPSKELAELIGIILGDGNIWCKKGGYYYLRIAGDANKDRDYLLNYVKPLFERLFNKKIHKIERPKSNALFISVGNKDVVYTLKYFGLKEGNKMKNNVKIPNWIFKSEEYIIPCIRGLIDTDGSVCPITGRNYPYIWFSCDIANLRKTFDRAMKKLEIKTSNWNIREGRTPDIYIGSKTMISRYLTIISFKNERHLSKIRKYAPVI